ncbi:MBOAT family O-acyltransferase [Methylocapsa acidiphila]|uniref:MBOAT family O-acyltransferase n=1 Tax=Methylocapsa acidiphila TaxID=133552 RepID=UPI0003FE2ABD|nr:MBOAT family O-acyltransferase [Methylocapsa acidiphila]
MLFNSFEYAVFFAAILAVYFRLPVRPRWPILLIASYIFYMGWRPLFVFLLMFTTLVDYVGGRIIDGAKRELTRRLALVGSVSINVGLLAFFKYYNFFISNVHAAASGFGYDYDFIYIDVILPVGISFYTFQSLSYTFDVYARKLPAERNLLRYALYVAFFPQLEAGPIERAARLVPQIQKDKFADPQRFRDGLWLIGYGLFKKMCISDLIAPVVIGIYKDPHQYNGSYLLLATALFAIQIYCDFSGYSNIAIGSAKMLGFDLMTNFRQPYFSRSLTEFWRRWHISLSTWFRDYVYFPLGGSRLSMLRSLRNVMIVFLLSGVWHGAAWTFIIWGGLHGAILCVERLGGAFVERTSGVRRIVETRGGGLFLGAAGFLWTSAIVLVGWVFFRANSLADALWIIGHLGRIGPIDYGTFKVLGLASFEIVLAIFQISLLLSIDYLIFAKPDLLVRWRNIRALGMAAAVALFYNIILFGIFEKAEFIYFQF